jgi:hypothetical protein
MVTKIYKKLSKDQINKGVLFSSCLSPFRFETKDSTTHEVFKINKEDFKDKPTYELIKAQEEQAEHIKRLKDDKFFNESNFKFNIIRQ